MRSTHGAAYRRFGFIVLLLVPLAVSSSSLPTPVSRFDVGGTIVRPGGSLDNYTVVLLAKAACQNSEWRRLDAGGIALTRVNGAFSLSGEEWAPPCSVSVAVVFPDTMILGTAFRVGEPDVTEYDSYTDDGFLCDDTVTYETAYVHYYHDSVVEVP